MHKISTIIIDDEPKAIDVIRRYCNDSDIVEVTAVFRDPLKAIEFLQQHKVDLLFLDINMPRISGLEFLNILSERPKVIFTTAYSEYALESYNYDAVDYLLKPIDFKRFLKAVSKAKMLINSNGKKGLNSQSDVSNDKILYIKSGPQLHKVNSNDILYLEKDGNYLTFYTKDKKILSRQNMKDIFDVLDSTKFIRVHKSYVVAVQHMDIIESHQIKIGNDKVPVGRIYREELMRLVSNTD